MRNSESGRALQAAALLHAGDVEHVHIGENVRAKPMQVAIQMRGQYSSIELGAAARTCRVKLQLGTCRRRSWSSRAAVAFGG